MALDSAIGLLLYLVSFRWLLDLYQFLVDGVIGPMFFYSVVTFPTTNSSVMIDKSARLGEGAYSVVFKGFQRFKPSKKFAVKRILVQGDEFERMAMSEVQALRRFRHEAIIQIIDHTTRFESGMKATYILLPLVDNGSLRDLLNQVVAGERPALSLHNVMANFLKVCAAFNVLHTNDPSYVHQDVKPENVLMGSSDCPLLTDFGSVRRAEIHVNTRLVALSVAEDAAQMCTASYRPPELYDPPTGCRLDSRTDVWGIGCLLFAWWFGYSPFECDFNTDSGAPRVVECSALRVLAPIPRKPILSKDDVVVVGLVEWILEQDIQKRPFTKDIIGRVEDILANINSAGV